MDRKRPGACVFHGVAILAAAILGAANANIELRADHYKPGPMCLAAESDPAAEAVVRKAIDDGEGFDGETFRIVLQYNVLRRSDGSGGFTQFDLIDAFEGLSADLDVTLTSGGFFDDPAPVSNSEPASYGTIE